MKLHSKPLDKSNGNPTACIAVGFSLYCRWLQPVLPLASACIAVGFSQRIKDIKRVKGSAYHLHIKSGVGMIPV